VNAEDAALEAFPPKMIPGLLRAEPEVETRREWGRAFRMSDGALFVDDQDGSFDSYESAAAMTKLCWAESPYDFVVYRDVTDWQVSDER